MHESSISASFTKTAIAAALALGAAASHAATVTATFQVTASVAAQCSVSATDLAFGAVDPIGGNVDNSTTVTVKCTKNSSYTVGLNAGATAGSTIANRLMANGANTMRYQLYSDALRSVVWGNASGSWVSGTGAGMGTAQPLTVYARVPSGQTNL